MTDALCQLIAWKPGPLQAYARAFVALLMAQPFAGPDDLPECDQPDAADARSIPGNAIKMLAHAHVIRRYEGHNPEAGIWHGRRISKRGSAKSRPVQLWQVASRSMAEAWLRRNGVAVRVGQLDLFKEGAA